MAYLITIFWFLKFASIAIGVALLLRFARRPQASLIVLHGVTATFIAVLVTPPLAVSVGWMDDIFIDPKYFTGPYLLSISPVALGMFYIVSVGGMVLGFTSGCWIGYKRLKTKIG